MTDFKQVMTNISKSVENFLSDDLSIQSCLAKKIINTTALAKYIIKNTNISGSLDSVISAIRRFNAKEKFLEHSSILKNVFQGAPIDTKMDLIAIDIRSHKYINKCLNEINTLVNSDEGDTLRLIKGSAYLRLITNSKNLEFIEDIINLNDKIQKTTELVELSIRTNPEIDTNFTKGVMSRISNELARNNINILQTIFSKPNILIYVNKKDYLNAHKTLLRIAGHKV